VAEGELWRVVGFDTFAREEYGIGSYATREEAMTAARAKLAIIARNQPFEVAGSLQDDVAVVSPEGESIAIDPG
jgi:hypothetical protein